MLTGVREPSCALSPKGTSDMNIRFRDVKLLIVAMTLLLSVPLDAQVQLARQVIASGGTAAGAPNGFIAGTIGQTIIGPATSSSHAGFLGFWYTYPRPQIGGASEEYNSAVTGVTARLRVAPNPVISNATITITLPASGDVLLKLYTSVGEERMTLIDGYRFSGTTTVQLPASGLESGYYTLVLQTAGSRTSIPMRVLQ